MMDPMLRKGKGYKLELFGQSSFIILKLSNREIVGVYNNYNEGVKTFERLEAEWPAS